MATITKYQCDGCGRVYSDPHELQKFEINITRHLASTSEFPGGEIDEVANTIVDLDAQCIKRLLSSAIPTQWSNVQPSAKNAAGAPAREFDMAGA